MDPSRNSLQLLLKYFSRKWF